MLAGEAELVGQVRADHVAIEQRHVAPTVLHQLDHQRVGDGGLARAGQAGEEHGEALLVARRIAAAQLRDHLRVGEPLGDVLAGAQAAAELGARDAQHRVLVGGLVRRHVLLLFLDEHHHLEGHHLDAEFVAELRDQLLRIVGTVEVLALAILARAGVVAADDEVRTAVILADDGVPERLARAAHAHGQRQQAEHGGVGRVALQQLLVAAHAGEVVDVAGLGQAHHRLDQQVCIGDAGGAVGQLLVGTVHRVAGLEGDHALPVVAGEVLAQLRRRAPQLAEVVVHRRGQAVERAAEVDRVGLVQQMVHARVLVVGAAEHLFGLDVAIRPVDVLHGQYSDAAALAILQHDALAGAQALGEALGHIEVDRHRPDQAGGQAHVVHHALVVGLVEVAHQWREAAGEQQLQVAQLALGQRPGRVVRRAPGFLCPLLPAEVALAERAAMWRDQILGAGRDGRHSGISLAARVVRAAAAQPGINDPRKSAAIVTIGDDPPATAARRRWPLFPAAGLRTARSGESAAARWCRSARSAAGPGACSP